MNCAFCGREIPADVLARRHYTDEQLRVLRIHCNRACDNADRKANGAFKAMSVAGREQRSKAVTVSNQRRRRTSK